MMILHLRALEFMDPRPKIEALAHSIRICVSAPRTGLFDLTTAVALRHVYIPFITALEFDVEMESITLVPIISVKVTTIPMPVLPVSVLTIVTSTRQNKGNQWSFEAEQVHIWYVNS